MTKYTIIQLDEIKESFKNYRLRIFENNTKWFMFIVRYASPIAAFKPVVIKINDLNINVKLDFFNKDLLVAKATADISMSSESLNFLLKNSFGFDTLTVNGCFEEEGDSGFSRAARTIAIENLHNMGIQFRPSIILNVQLITLFVSRLWAVSKKIRLSKKVA